MYTFGGKKLKIHSIYTISIWSQIPNTFASNMHHCQKIMKPFFPWSCSKHQFFVSVHITAVVIPFLEILVTWKTHIILQPFFGLWIDYTTGRRPHGPFRDSASPLLLYCLRPTQCGKWPSKAGRPKQSGDSELWKVLENCSRVSAAFFNDFLELMRRKKWNNTILFYFPWGRDFCQRESYKTLFFGLGAVKQWHFLSFCFFVWWHFFICFSLDDTITSFL